MHNEHIHLPEMGMHEIGTGEASSTTRQILWSLIALATALTSLGITALLRSFFERSFATQGIGLPYEVCAAAIGIAFSGFILYCGFLLASSWNNHKFARAIQVFLAACAAISVTATAWFSIGTGQLNLVNIMCLFFVCCAAVLGSKVAEQIRRAF